ncbi:MAG: NADH-quinone oxidoreductase subunit A [Dehalococcoidia bacterium]
MNNYAAVLLAVGIGVGMVLAALISARILAPFSSSKAKSTPYECGMLPIGSVRTQMSIRYYLYAILFLVFDAEAVFLFPWAVSLLGVGKAAFFEMVLFLAVMGAGLIYAWKKGALEWR